MPVHIRFRLLLALALIAAGCVPSSNQQNPFDPTTPVTQEAKATLTGTVTVEALPGATADPSGVTVTLQGSVTTVTAADGSFTLAQVPVGNYTVSLSKTGYDTLLQQVAVPQSDAAQTSNVVGPYALALARGNVSGSAQLTGASSSAGISVTLSMGATSAAATVTDGNGDYVFNSLPVGLYSAAFSYAGYTPVMVTGQTISSNQTLTIPTQTLSLISTGGITGQAVLSGPGTLSGGAALLQGTNVNGVLASNTATLDDMGNFSFSGLAEGTYGVSVSVTGYQTLAVPAAPLPPGGMIALGMLQLTRATGAFAGTVAVEAGASGVTLVAADVAGIAVTVSDPSLSAEYTGTTDSTGSYAISDVPAPVTAEATYTLLASKTGFQTTTITAALNPELPTTSVSQMTLTASAFSVSGPLLLSFPATGTSGAAVSLAGAAFNGSPFAATARGMQSTSTEYDYAFGNIPVGAYTLTLSAPGFVAVTLPVSVQGNVTVPSTTLSQRATGTLAGSVTLSNGGTNLSFSGSDYAAIVVSVQGADLGMATYSTTCNQSGGFVLANIPVNVNSPYSVVAASGSDFTQTSPVSASVTAGSVTTVNGLGLTLNTGTVQVTAALYDQQGAGGTTQPQSLPDEAVGSPAYTTVPVTLTGQAYNQASVGPITLTTSAANGIALFSPLPPGTYQLSATLAQHVSSPVTTTLPPGGNSTPGIALTDVAGPTPPIVAATTATTTSATRTNISLVQAATDPTMPQPNLWGYMVEACTGTTTLNCSSGFQPWVFGGVGATSPYPTVFTAGTASSVTYNVYAVDDDGNVSAPATPVTVSYVGGLPVAPVNVHVDNRPQTVRVSWDPPDGGADIGGYLVYYGPSFATADSDYSVYTGTAASAGPSPINVGNATSVVMDGLPNNDAFYVAVATYDTVTEPGPDVSALTAPILANPNTTPYDRAVSYQVTASTVQYDGKATTTGPAGPANSLAVVRDDLLVSSGAASPFTITPYAYQQYGTLQGPSTAITSVRGRTLVADPPFAYGFDVGYGTKAAQTGVDVLNWESLQAPSVLGTNFLSGDYVGFIIPAHRSDIGGAGKTHGFFTYLSGSTYYLATFSRKSDHASPQADSNAIAMSSAAPTSVAVAGNLVFVASNVGITGYQVSADFTKITASASVLTLPHGSAAPVLTVDAGATTVVGSVVSSRPTLFIADGSDGTVIYSASVTGTSPLTFSTTVNPVAALHGQALAMAIDGDQLMVTEYSGLGLTAMESFTIPASYAGQPLAFGGTYDLNQGKEYNNSSTVSIAPSGTNLFLLTNDGEFLDGWVDVVEVGGPRAIVHQATLDPVVGTNSGTEFDCFGVAIKGTRAIAYLYDRESGLYLADIDLLNGFASTSQAVESANLYASSANYSVHSPYIPETPYDPMIVEGDYAYVVTEAGTTSSNISILDVATPAALNGASPIATIAATGIVNALAVVDDYLVAVEVPAGGGTNWIERWDLTSITAPVGPVRSTASLASGTVPVSIALAGATAYVGTTTGICTVNVFSLPAAATCTATGLSGAIDVDSERLFVADGYAQETVSMYPVTGLSGTPTVLAASTSGQSPVEGAMTMGPNLFVTEGSYGTGTGALVGLDVTSTVNLPLSSDPTVQFGTPAAFAASGSILVVPNDTYGVTLDRAY